MYAAGLAQKGWEVLYICIPNTPHVGVVPIPTSHGVSKQRYPDIAAIKNGRILLVEVEMSLTESVVQDIRLRFAEMREALASSETYRSWSAKVELATKRKMPTTAIVEACLKVVNSRDQRSAHLIDQLEADSIVVAYD